METRTSVTLQDAQARNGDYDAVIYCEVCGNLMEKHPDHGNCVSSAAVGNIGRYGSFACISEWEKGDRTAIADEGFVLASRTSYATVNGKTVAYHAIHRPDAAERAEGWDYEPNPEAEAAEARINHSDLIEEYARSQHDHLCRCPQCDGNGDPTDEELAEMDKADSVASDNTLIFTHGGDPVRILGTDPRSAQALAYQKWIEEQVIGLDAPLGYYEGQDYPTIEEMAWEEPEEVRAMRKEQAARLAAMSDEERQAWLDEQNEEAGRRFDARGGRW